MIPSILFRAQDSMPGPVLVLLIVLAIAVPVLNGQTRTTVDDESRAAVVGELGTLLRDRYVYAETGARCADELERRLAAGDLDTLTDAGDLGQVLTRILQEISEDRHLRVGPAHPMLVLESTMDTEAARQEQLEESRRRNFGFEQILRVDGGVGVLDLRGFEPVEHAGETAIAAMNFLGTSDALVIDLRQNGGGDPEMVQLISSYFFSEPTHLNSLYWRADDRTDEFWTHEEVAGRRMADVPLFVVTSQYTFSAAEEFAYNLKTRERATIVGETTGGGAHPVDVHELPAGLSVWLPEGRAINPVTGTNWEGTGVAPDVEADANAAFDKALELARKAAKEHRKARLASS